MPELPEVEFFRSIIEKCLFLEICGFEVRDEQFFITPVRDYGRILVGNEFVGVGRRGKFLVVDLRLYSLKLVFHFGMTGDLSYSKTGELEEKHVRVVFRFVNGYELRVIDQRRFGKLYLVEDMVQVKTIRNMGGEPLEMDEKNFLDVCNRHPRRTVKSFLMDQSVIAGIGNIYSDEILFQAGVRPNRKIGDLTEAEKRGIFRKMREVLEKMVRADANFWGFKDFLLPYREGGAKCPKCGGALETLKIANRTSYYCPRCQS
ncbi:MAG: DNA-formamidopyrimidine glycosylase family protein [Candidatus Jordarchaeaceae archaeon]